MNFEQLKYIVEIERCGSINKASQTLFVTQPALSASIKELEGELGFTIFERSNKGIRPTAEGSQFVRSANDILSQIEKIRNFYFDGSSASTSVLRISSGRYSFVTNALIEFFNEHFKDKSQFSIYIDELGCQEVALDVFNRKADMGIIHIKNSEEDTWKRNLEEKGLEYNLLFNASSCITFRKGHPLQNKKNIKMEDIFEYPQIRTTAKSNTYCNYDATPSFPFYERFEKNIFTNNRNVVYDCLSRTDAVFFCITGLYITDFHPDLVTIPIPGDKTSWGIYYVKLKNLPLNANTMAFLKILKEQGAPVLP